MLGRSNLGHHEFGDDQTSDLNNHRERGAEDQLKQIREQLQKPLSADQGRINSSGTVKPNYEIGERDFLD